MIFPSENEGAVRDSFRNAEERKAIRITECRLVVVSDHGVERKGREEKQTKPDAR